MTTRIFLNVRRGVTDATAVCVYPWEKPLLELIHGQDCEEVSIERMSEIKDGVVRKEKVKFKYDGMPGPDLRQQLEAMAYVDAEEDPALDPAAEYNRLVDKYGMDKDMPVPVVTRVYGEFNSGAFESVLKKHAEQRSEMPMHMKAKGEGLDRAPEKMSVAELRDALRDRGIKYKVTDSREVLREKLEQVLVT